MNIVHVCRQFLPGIGGMEGFIEQLCRQQIAAEHNVRVVTLDKVFDAPDAHRLAKFETIKGIPVSRIPFVGSKRYPFAPGILPSVRGADIIHVHGVDFFADFLALTRPIHGARLVLSTHGGFFHTGFAQKLKRLFFNTITRLSLTQYDAVVASSQQDEAMFRQVSKARLLTIENGVDINKFAGLANSAAHTMIYFGRLAPNKRIDRVIRWFAKVHAHDDRWRLIIAGKPAGVQTQELLELAGALGVEDCIELHSSPSDALLAELIARSSVYVCASSYEGFGLAAVEAVSGGLFPILSKIHAFERTITRLGLGEIADFEADAANVIATLDRTNAKRERLFPQDYKAAVEGFDWPAVSQAFENVYSDVLGLKRRMIGDVRVAVLDHDSALHAANTLIERKQGGIMTFCNAHSVNVARGNPAFRQAINAATVLNDGVGVSIASKVLFRKPFPCNLNGTDFVPALLASRTVQTRVFLLGSAPGVAARAARAFEARYPLIQIVGTEHGFVGQADELTVVDRIKHLSPDIILVGMGQPHQEIWAERHANKFFGTTICVGALLDFTAGVVTRAPLFVRRMRMEWVYRLALEPRRLMRRYLIGNAAFLVGIFRQRVAGSTFVASH